MFHRGLTFWATAALVLSVLSASPARRAPAQPPGSAPARKLALLVGISQYERPERYPPEHKSKQPPDWWNLNTSTEIERIKQILVERFGFAEADVLMLREGQATRQGIIDAFRRHLVQKAGPGDLVYFHYSGHGQRIPDDNGDETDGMDESLVTADYRSQDARENAETNLRDDTIGQLLKELKGKMTPAGSTRMDGNITLTFDCCFSGSATRGYDMEQGWGRLPKRGRDWDVAIDGPKPPPQGRGVAKDSTGLLDEGEAVAQGYVVLTATRNDEVANEKLDESKTPMGAFSYYLLRALNKAIRNTTYSDLFERVNAELTSDMRNQNPTIEGDQSKLLFSGEARPSDPYLVVQRFDADLGKLTLPVGRLQGATLASGYAIYRAGSDVKNKDNQIAEAEVNQVDSTTCVATLQGDRATWPKPEDLSAARAVETSHGFGDCVLLLWMDKLDGPIADEIKTLKVVSREDVTKDTYDVSIHPDVNEPAKYVVVERKDGTLRKFEASAQGTPKKIREELFGAWKWKYVGMMNSGGPGSLINVDIRLVAVDVQFTPAKKIDLTKVKVRDDIKPVGNKLTVTEGEFVMLELRNTSAGFPAYFNVLDLAPTGEISSAYPDAHKDIQRFGPADDPGKARWVSLQPYIFRTKMSTDRPSEVDRFKAFGTTEYCDLSALLYTGPGEDLEAGVKRGVATQRGGRNHGLVRLLGAAVLGEDPDPTPRPGPPPPKLRGADPIPTEVTDWGTAEFILEVKRKK